MQEKNGGEGEKAENRHGLEDVENGDQHHAGPAGFGGERGVGEGEEQRKHQGREHARGGAQRVIGQPGRVEMNGAVLDLGDGRADGRAPDLHQSDEQPHDDEHGRPVETVRHAVPSQGRKGVIRHRAAPGFGWIRRPP